MALQYVMYYMSFLNTWTNEINNTKNNNLNNDTEQFLKWAHQYSHMAMWYMWQCLSAFLRMILAMSRLRAVRLGLLEISYTVGNSFSVLGQWVSREAKNWWTFCRTTASGKKPITRNRLMHFRKRSCLRYGSDNRFSNVSTSTGRSGNNRH